jgi:hypothetical protein
LFSIWIKINLGKQLTIYWHCIYVGEKMTLKKAAKPSRTHGDVCWKINKILCYNLFLSVVFSSSDPAINISFPKVFLAKLAYFEQEKKINLLRSSPLSDVRFGCLSHLYALVYSRAFWNPWILPFVSALSHFWGPITAPNENWHSTNLDQKCRIDGRSRCQILTKSHLSSSI